MCIETHHVERRLFELVEVHEVAFGDEALVDARHLLLFVVICVVDG
jgi:hypothetical protein